jgi:hypothetical protein
MERERVEAQEDLEFRRGLYKVQEECLEAARRERSDAIRQFENLKATAIHTCHDQCQRPMCVLRRERDEAKANLKITQEAWVKAKVDRVESTRERDEAREQNAKLRDIAERAIEEMESGDPVGTSDAYRAELDQLKEGAK